MRPDLVDRLSSRQGIDTSDADGDSACLRSADIVGPRRRDRVDAVWMHKFCASHS